jgi:hypothetical protein
MTKIGKDANGVVMYVEDDLLRAVKNGSPAPGNNQQKAKIRKIAKSKLM